MSTATICTHFDPAVRRGCALGGLLHAPRDCKVDGDNRQRVPGCQYSPVPWREKTGEQADQTAIDDWKIEMRGRQMRREATGV